MSKPKVDSYVTTAQLLLLALYLLTIVLHTVNGAYTLVWVLKVMDKEPELKQFFFFSYRFYSIWTIIIHVVNASIGIICFENVFVYTKISDKHIDNLRRFKEVFFCAIVWPTSWVCSTVFWFFYHYDKNLVRFHLLMKVGYPLNNHIEHTFIVIAAMCEALLQSVTEPKSHKNNILFGLSVVIVYFLTLLYTFVSAGTWLYPFLDVAHDAGYLPLTITVSCVLYVAFYYVQWPLVRFKEEGSNKIRNFGLPKKDNSAKAKRV